MKHLFIIVALTIFIAQSASAQFGNILGKAAERAAQRKAEQAVEKKVEQAIDKALDTDNTKAKTNKDKVVIDGKKTEVTIEEDNTAPVKVDPSKFIGSYTTTIISTEKGVEKDKPVVMNQYIDAYQTALEMSELNSTEQEKINLIFDRRDRTMTTLTTDKKGNKSGVKIKMPKTTVKIKESSDKKDTQKPVRTGETKTIEGYTCVKYTFEDDKHNSESWVAESIDIDVTQFAESFNMGIKRGSVATNTTGIKGLAMETITRSKDTQKAEVMTIKISNLKIGSVDKAKFSTDGYEIQDASKMFGNDR